MLPNLDQSGLHGIILYISNDVVKFLVRTDPVIERFILPKRHSGAAQTPVRLATRPSFEPPHNRWQRGVRLEHDVNVIGHDNPAAQSVEAARCFTIEKSVLDESCDAGFSEPEGTAGRTVEAFVAESKGKAGRCSPGSEYRDYWEASNRRDAMSRTRWRDRGSNEEGAFGSRA